jgi:hypothetical protein
VGEKNLPVGNGCAIAWPMRAKQEQQQNNGCMFFFAPLFSKFEFLYNGQTVRDPP